MNFRILFLSCAAIVASVLCGGVTSHFNGGRVPPVHRLTPLDADGDKVSPSGDLPASFSQEKTCGQCHDVPSLRGGSHFRTGLTPDDSTADTGTEPWFLADERTGTAIPLSLHGQPRTFAPRDVGFSCWQWTKAFGRHFPGGGVASDTNAMAEVAGEAQRWFVTGPLDANCLACHQQRGYDASEWARQVARENWSGAAAAASGLACVEGMNARLDAAWDRATQPVNPDDHLFKVPEKTIYDVTRFDAKGRCVFDVGKPRPENCLACHAASEKGVPSHDLAGDVHLQRGMTCVTCHRNGMDHRLQKPSCKACHTGANGAGPRPKHAGMPLVHFERLSCRTCHTGVTKDGARAQVRTARANRIGIYGRAQWATDTPYVVEPVFVKKAKSGGKIGPCRVAWPSYFCTVTNGVVARPLVPDAVKDLAALKTTNAFTKAVVKAALTELAGDGTHGDFAFVGHGRLWRLEGTNLVAGGAAAARPVFWPFAHDVRPARQARGAAPVKCAACHTPEAEFFQAAILPQGPMADVDAGELEPLVQADLLGVGADYHRFLGSTFAMRPILKTFLWTVFALMCLFAAAAAAVALNKLGKWISAETGDFIWGLAKWVVDMGLAACTVYLALSGVLGWYLGAMRGIWLVLHMVAGGGFACCAALVMLFRAWERTEKPVSAVLWALWTLLAAATVFTAVMPMMTVFGAQGQELLLWCHRGAALAFTAVGGVLCRRAFLKK